MHLDRVPNFENSKQTGWNSLEPTGKETLQNLSGNIREIRRRKPGSNWRSFPENPHSEVEFSVCKSRNIFDSDTEEPSRNVNSVEPKK